MAKHSKLKQLFCNHKHYIVIATIPAGTYINHQITRNEIKIFQCLCCGKKFVLDLLLDAKNIDYYAKKYKLNKSNNNDFNME